MEIDTSAWEVAVKLPHGYLYWIEPGIVAGMPDEGVIEDLELSRHVFEGYVQCVDEAGRPLAVVVLVDRLGDQTSEVREYWQQVMTPEVMSCCALVSKSFFARAISSFLLGLRKPRVPTKMFSNLEQAVAWSRDQLG